jgi:hypothetical protein
LFLSAQSPVFVKPIEGTYGQDFIIVNYVDWKTGDSIIDHKCGTKTYDGHQGTDFVISGFPQMDEGVDILAVDSGVVIFVHDGEFDRNTDGNPDLGLGNYVAIKHPDKHFSYYGHQRKNSIVVSVGDMVVPGQVIGQVGSSGNSTDPHLHFELWYDSLFLVDPFAGFCGNNYSFWIDSLPYDTSFNVWDSGLCDYVPPIDSLRERPVPRTSFNNQDSVITFWNLQYGIKAGDSTRIEWLMPNGNLWFEYSLTYEKDWWFYYYYSYIFTPPDNLLGEWAYNYYYNDSLVLSGNFLLELPLAETEIGQRPGLLVRYSANGIITLEIPEKISEGNVELYDLSGKCLLKRTFNKNNKKKHILLDVNTENIQHGLYLIVLKSSNGIQAHKIIL